MIWNLQAKGCGVQSDSRARIPPAYAKQQRPQVRLRHGFNSYFSGYPGGGLEREHRRARAFGLRGDGNQCRQYIAEFPNARLDQTQNRCVDTGGTASL